MQPSWSSSNSPVRGRRGRLSTPQQRALQELADPILANQELDIAVIWGDARPLIVDIGFGSGESTVDLAERFPDHAVLAIDVHPPGIARLLSQIDERGLDNIRIIAGHAVDVFDRALANVRVKQIVTLFPDPWPKARHHKRRLLQSSTIERLTSRTAEDATWLIATDWEPYAEHISESFTQHAKWTGGVVPRPARVVTKYEKRGRSAGRPITDFHFTRIP